MNKIIITLSVIVIVIGLTLTGQADDFSFKVGVGYDFISQEYFYDSLAYTILPDSNPALIMAATLLQREYLDDKKGLIYVKYDHNNMGRKVLQIGWEQTPEIYRAIARGHLTFGKSINSIEVDFDLDSRQKYTGTPTEGEEISVFNGYLKYRRKFSDKVESSLKIKAESVNFDSTSPSVYNYTQAGIEATLSAYSENFNLFRVSAGIEQRFVPDSALLECIQIKSGLGYSGALWGGFFSGDIFVENRSHGQDNKPDDYLAGTIGLSFKAPLGREFYLRPKINSDYYNYNDANLYFSDYTKNRFDLIVEREFDCFSLSAGPRVEFMSIIRESDLDDDYSEYGLETEFDFMNLNGLFILVSNHWGRREYPKNPELLSNFYFNRIGLTANIQINKNLNFDLLFSGEWEWHQNSGDNSRLYLFSTGINYNF